MRKKEAEREDRGARRTRTTAEVRGKAEQVGEATRSDRAQRGRHPTEETGTPVKKVRSRATVSRRSDIAAGDHAELRLDHAGAPPMVRGMPSD